MTDLRPFDDTTYGERIRMWSQRREGDDATRKEVHGGLRTDQAKRTKDLSKENARLRRLLVDAEFDEAILREAASGCRRRA
jgi:hypothetical protein